MIHRFDLFIKSGNYGINLFLYAFHKQICFLLLNLQLALKLPGLLFPFFHHFLKLICLIFFGYQDALKLFRFFSEFVNLLQQKIILLHSA